MVSAAGNYFQADQARIFSESVADQRLGQDDLRRVDKLDLTEIAHRIRLRPEPDLPLTEGLVAQRREQLLSVQPGPNLVSPALDFHVVPDRFGDFHFYTDWGAASAV